MTAPHYVRAMGTFEIFRSAFELYRRNFRQFFLMNVTAVAAYLIINLLNAVLIYNLNPGGGAESVNLPALCLGALLPFVNLAVLYVVLAATLVATSNAVLGRPISVRGAYRRILSAQLLGRFLLASFLVSIIVDIGLVLFIIPGIVFFVWFLFVPLIITLEWVGVRTALGRSRKLIHHNFWRVLLTAGCYVVPVTILYLAVSAIAKSALGISPDNVGLSQLVSLSVSSVIGLLIESLTGLIFSLLYYNARVRKENYNEAVLAVEMG